MRSCSGCLVRGNGDGDIVLSGAWRRRVRLCTGVNVASGSTFCLECWRRLVSAAKFRRLCRTSARILRTTNKNYVKKEENVKYEFFNQGSKGSWDAFEANDPFDFSNDLFHQNEVCYDFANVSTKNVASYIDGAPETSKEIKISHFPSNTGSHYGIPTPLEQPESFKCELCFEFFTKNELLENHLKEKHFDGVAQNFKVEVPLSVDQKYDKLTYRCLKCNREFSVLHIFKEHLKHHHEFHEKPHPFLNTCKNLNDVYEHENSMNLDNNVPISQPETINVQQFQNNVPLKVSFENIETKKISLTRCKFCLKNVHQSYLLKHVAQFHNEKIITTKNPLKCPKCGKNFKLSTNLDAHMRQHYGLKPFVCQICFKELSNRKTYKMHMNRHNGKKKYVCNVCDKTFTYPTVLKMHKRIHLGIKKYSCENCNISFTQSNHLKNHMKTHSQERSFKCEECDKSFKTKNILKCHIDRHRGSRNYVCSICGKSFITSGELNSHAKSHSNNKSFSCSACNKFFKTQRQLSEHNRRHTGERPFKCNVCSKDFMTSQVLKRHMMIHTGMKPFICHICNNTYTQKYMLNKHIESHKQNLQGICFEN